jgi:hypothetical protein
MCPVLSKAISQFKGFANDKAGFVHPPANAGHSPVEKPPVHPVICPVSPLVTIPVPAAI